MNDIITLNGNTYIKQDKKLKEKSTAKSVKAVKRKRRTNERINQSNLRKRPPDSIRT